MITHPAYNNFTIRFYYMLPILTKPATGQDFKPAQSKLYQNKDLPQQKSRKQPLSESGRYSVKGKVGGGGFKLSNTYEQPIKSELRGQNQYAPQSAKVINYSSNQKRNGIELKDEIRLIEKKIRQCQKKLDLEKKRKLQQERRDEENRYEQDFEEIIRKEMQLHGVGGGTNDPSKNFDYLTNPGGPPQQQQEIPVEEPVEQLKEPPPYSIAQGLQKLQKFYQKSLKKKFQRRQVFPHMACRRKTPKLYITQKTNALSKHGKPLTEEQHKFRIFTKETTPQEIYPVIPNFAVVKDNLSKNIVAYLGDYKPFIEKTKEKVEKNLGRKEKEEGELVMENASKSLTVNN